MPLPRKILNDYETIALDLHPHWWYFAPPAATLAGSIVAAIIVKLRLDGDAERWLSLLLLAVIILSAIWLVVRYVKWANTNFAVTSHRMIYRSGVLSKTSVEIPLERVNNVNSHQSVFERLIGAGDLLIESAGEAGRQRYSDIRNPIRVQSLIQAQIEAKTERNRSGAVAASVDVADQLERLEALRDRGTITDAEFQAQKQRLLG
jgi:uncharacterized membrane protein YdbT with pleckstrin-like domain